MGVSYNTKHFLLSALLTLILGVVVTALFQMCNQTTIYMWYCLPIMLVYLGLEYLLFWASGYSFAMLAIFNVVLFIVSSLSFFLPFFIIFHPSQKYSFLSADSCSITGRMQPNLRGVERFAILQVDVKYEGKSMLGYGCSSNLNQDDSSSHMNPYSFYEYDEAYLSGDINKGPSYDLTARRVLQNERDRLVSLEPAYKQRRHLMRGRSTTSSYKFSNVKIPSWMCLSNNVSYADLIGISKCKIAFYGEDDRARQTAVNRDPIRWATDFAMVIFDDRVYFQKDGLICLIIFAYLPMLVSIIPVFALLVKCMIADSSNAVVNFEKNSAGSSSQQIEMKGNVYEQNDNSYYDDESRVQYITRKNNENNMSDHNNHHYLMNQKIHRHTTQQHCQIALFISPEQFNELKKQHATKMESE